LTHLSAKKDTVRNDLSRLVAEKENRAEEEAQVPKI
jgi:hypothetical protein